MSFMKKKELTSIEKEFLDAKNELFEAVEQKAIARQNFDNAEPDFIEIAILQMQTAEAHFSEVDKRVKLLKEKLNIENIELNIPIVAVTE